LLAWEFIQRYVPEEDPVFEEVANDFLDNPTAFESTAAPDNALGFGFSDLITLATPAVISMISVVFTKFGESIMIKVYEATTAKVTETLIDKVAESLNKESSEGIEALKKTLLEETIKYGVPTKNQQVLVEKIMNMFRQKNEI
jgi:hypothetical protein